MMEAAEETRTTTTASVTVNVGYPTSWQGVLKIAKCVFLFSCLVCSAIIVNEYKSSSNPSVDYCLAVAVIGFIAELVIFILYVVGLNKRWADNAVCGILMMVYHLLMLILIFAACIIMTGIGYPYLDSSRAYNAFGIFTIMGFSLDVYFNIIWIRGGPELAALAIPGQ
ncbi:uncharacterized protein [Watersipora subatra]|uniref:uncharacterized protein n=1 Tax=Watersipora subatra TaxID=2589382 RepID=UPI00355C4EA7